MTMAVYIFLMLGITTIHRNVRLYVMQEKTSKSIVYFSSFFVSITFGNLILINIVSSNMQYRLSFQLSQKEIVILIFFICLQSVKVDFTDPNVYTHAVIHARYRINVTM